MQEAALPSVPERPYICDYDGRMTDISVAPPPTRFGRPVGPAVT